MTRRLAQRWHTGPCSRIRLMSQEPGPELPGAPATARNWQDPPVNRWAYWHVGEILPTYPVSRGDGPLRPLPAGGGGDGLLEVPVTRADGSIGTVGEVMAGTPTPAHLVIPDGELGTQGDQVRRRLRGRRADRPRPARPGPRGRRLRPRTGRQRLRRRPGPARLRHAQRGQ